MNVDLLKVDFSKYESPIQKLVMDVEKKVMQEEETQLFMTIKQAIGFSVDKEELLKALKYDRNQYEQGYIDGLRANDWIPDWIPVSERLPELNRPLWVTAYHRVCYAHMISKSGNYGYPVFRLHELKDSDRGWVQETISHEPYNKGRIDAWMYIDIPQPYVPDTNDGKMGESEVSDETCD